MEKKDLLSFMQSVIDDLRTAGCHGTAHIYQNSLNSFAAFYQQARVPFRQMTPELLKHFENHLRQRRLSWNTISTYLRTLRATYNRAVDRRLAPYVPHLFKHVYTGTRADKKRALEAKDMALLLHAPACRKPFPAAVCRIKDLFVLMFLLRGLPFVDLAYLHKEDLQGNTITYRRHKTGRQLTVTLTPEAMSLLLKYMDTNPHSPYLFPILHSAEGTREAYREYQIALRSFNYHLRLLGELLNIRYNLSTYTARHTWATLAYHCEIHPGIISEAMGHSSITVTETYLKPFHSQKIHEANQEIITYVKRWA